jgi:large subunit ribosomal protein L19
VPIQSPNIEKIELVKRAKVRQGKLYFIRERSAKSLKMKYKDLAAVAKVEEEKEVITEPVEKTTTEEAKDKKAVENKTE